MQGYVPVNKQKVENVTAQIAELRWPNVGKSWLIGLMLTSAFQCRTNVEPTFHAQRTFILAAFIIGPTLDHFYVANHNILHLG